MKDSERWVGALLTRGAMRETQCAGILTRRKLADPGHHPVGAIKKTQAKRGSIVVEQKKHSAVTAA